jgi:hypothetical protein
MLSVADWHPGLPNAFERSRAEEMLTACCVPYSWWDPVWREVATLPDTLTRGNAA